MENNNICDKCGAEMRVDRCGCAVTYTCPNCGRTIATTEWEPIDADKTQYAIHLVKGTPVCKETLSLVSQMTGKNFLDSKRAIETNEVIFVGKARDILKQKEYLATQDVAYVIEPDFPY